MNIKNRHRIKVNSIYDWCGYAWYGVDFKNRKNNHYQAKYNYPYPRFKKLLLFTLH